MKSLPISISFTLLLAACCNSDQCSHDVTNMVDKSELDVIIIENDRLKEQLQFIEYRSNMNGGAEMLLTQAEYHVDRGEHSLAQEKIDAVKEKHSEGPHAEKAAALEARMSSDEGEAIIPPDPNEHIEVVKDDTHGTTWYYDKRIPRDPDTTSFYLYMGHKETGAPWLRMRAQYAGDHWLYLQDVVFKSKDLVWKMNPDQFLIFNSSGNMFDSEWVDEPPTFEEIRIIKKLLAEPEVQIKFVGEKEHFTRDMTDNERDALINILDLYNSMVRLEELEDAI